MPRHHRLKDPVVQQSDLEGTGIYPVNTGPGKDPGAPRIPVYLNSEKLKRGLRPLEGKVRSFGPWAATVSGHRARTLNDAINAAGLNSSHNFEAKLCLLREAGATQGLITRVQLGEASRLLDSTLGANSYLTPESAQHLLWPAGPTGGFRNGVSGGHFTSWLLAMAGPHTPYAFLEVCVLEFAGTTLRLFTQFKWKGDGDKPMPGSGRAPGEPQWDPKDWVQADSPKTTFDDKAVLLRESNAAAADWVARHGNTDSLGGSFTGVTPSGIRMGGHLEPVPGPDGRIILRTAYVDATWLSERIAERALVRSDDLVARPTSLGELESLWLKLVRGFRLLLRVAELCRDLWVVGDLA